MRIATAPVGDFVDGKKVGFPTRPDGGATGTSNNTPPDVLKRIPAGPLRYRTGDPLAVITLTDTKYATGSKSFETHARWQTEDDLVRAEKRTGYYDDTVAMPLRDAVKMAFNRAEKSKHAQALLQAEDGYFWIARLVDQKGDALRIDGKDFSKDTVVHGSSENDDLVAIIGNDKVINFSMKYSIRKPHWWDFIAGKPMG